MDQAELLARLIELATKEAVDRGDADVTPLHLALAIASHAPVELNEAAGVDVGALFAQHLPTDTTENSTDSNRSAPAPSSDALACWKALRNAATPMIEAAALCRHLLEDVAGGARWLVENRLPSADRLVPSTHAQSASRGTEVVHPSTGVDGRPPTARPGGSLTAAEIEERLGEVVFGQDHVIHEVAQRLRLTRAGADLRAERPDGVFLFVGPSGCGKTELAYAIAQVVYGSRSRLIRYDMSEYRHEHNVSRMIGPPPGYQGNDSPEGWLTTRVAAQPETVVLLDEIEKAHPSVFQTFLQVFDAGQLTDGRGATADFSKCIFVLTSNLGSESYTRQATGFSGGSLDAGAGRVDESVLDHFPPEFINRLDGWFRFDPLSKDVLTAIIERESGQALDHLGRLGFEASLDDQVLQALVDAGHDPAYGARALHRLIENEIIAPAIDMPPGRIVAKLVSSSPLQVAWRPDQREPEDNQE